MAPTLREHLRTHETVLKFLRDPAHVGIPLIFFSHALIAMELITGQLVSLLKAQISFIILIV